MGNCISVFSYVFPIGQKMQLTGWHSGQDIRNATCAGSQNLFKSGPTVHFLNEFQQI